MLLRGQYCRCCLRSGPVQADHVMPRSQGGQSVVENGMPLCDECHRAKTEHRVLVKKSWLDADQLEYLETVGWVWWDSTGEVYGHGRKSFAQENGERQDGNIQ